MTAMCLSWTLSSVRSHPRLRIIIIVETARVCFLHASKKEMNSLNDDNDIWQVEVYARAVLFVVMTENSYLSNRYFISVLKMKTCDLNINTNCVLTISIHHFHPPCLHWKIYIKLLRRNISVNWFKEQNWLYYIES